MKKFLLLFVLLGLILPVFVFAFNIVFENPLGTNIFKDIVDKLTGFFFYIALGLAPVLIVIAAVLFVSAGGNPTQADLAKKIIILAFIILAVALLSRAIIYISTNILNFNSAPSEEASSTPPVIQKCLDGTSYGQCSSDKPKYCEEGVLVDKASLCGCPPDYEGLNDECKKNTPSSEVDAFIKDIFGSRANLIASENPSVFLGNDIGQHLFDTSWTNCQPMINKVNELTVGKSTNYEKAKSIISWLANSRQYSGPSPLTEGKSICESFSVNYGICHDSAYIGVAMLRLADIPSRVLGPVKGASHNYVEFYSDGKWYGIDGTFQKPLEGELSALERSAMLNVFQILNFDQPKELTLPEGWKGNYTDRTFSYSVKSIILSAVSKKNLLAGGERVEWGELTYPSPFYEISDSRIAGAKVVAKDLYCDTYSCSQSQGASQEINLPSGANILVAGDLIIYKNGQKMEELKDIISDQPFLFEDFYINTTLPPGQYQFWYGNIAFANIRINPGNKTEIKPDMLIKPSNITQKEFDDFITYLKTVE